MGWDITECPWCLEMWWPGCLLQAETLLELTETGEGLSGARRKGGDVATENLSRAPRWAIKRVIHCERTWSYQGWRRTS